MQSCHNCQAVIDEYILDKQLEPLRELTVDDFNVCSDCVTIVADGCVDCGGAVYVPRGRDEQPEVCPACRHIRFQLSGQDPGWNADSQSA